MVPAHLRNAQTRQQVSIEHMLSICRAKTEQGSVVAESPSVLQIGHRFSIYSAYAAKAFGAEHFLELGWMNENIVGRFWTYAWHISSLYVAKLTMSFLFREPKYYH